MPTQKQVDENLNFQRANKQRDKALKQLSNENLIKGVGRAFCGNSDEKTPKLKRAPCEKTAGLTGNHNAQIVLGRDRHSSIASGHGGYGSLQCGMIDLVAGRAQLIMANNEKQGKTIVPKELESVDPMFHSDAARVYITQKAEDIDLYFGLKQSGGPNAVNKSAVAVKGDHVRVIGREKVRIYCGRGNFEGFETGVGETNCLGQRLKGQVIELQVGDQELHPMVLGNKLIDYLKKQQEVNRKVYKQLLEMNIHLTTLNAAVSVLTFGSPPYTTQLRESISNIKQDVEFSLNSIIETINYLDSDLIPGNEHILSDSVYTT